MKRLALTILFCLLSVNAFAWGNGYSQRKIITIDRTKVSTVNGTTLTNFPVLISGTYAYLATTANGGFVFNTTTLNGQTVPADLIFTSDPQGNTLLSWEVESYTASSGLINVWVNAPILSPTTDQNIYMFYGNASKTTYQCTASSTWDANYKGVWHLPDGSTLGVLDSTNNDNGTNHSATAASGKIGGAAGTDTSKYITTSDANLPSGATQITMEQWIKTSSSSQSVISINYGTSAAAKQIYLGVYNLGGGAPTNAGIFGDQTWNIRTNTNINDNAWHRLVGVVDSGNLAIIYLDGVQINTRASSALALVLGGTFSMGQDFSLLNSQVLTGTLDEVRISNIARSADWISTEYNNQNSPSTFYTIQGASVFNNFTINNMTIGN